MSDFQAVFDRIRPMFAAHEPNCVVLRDGPEGYILGSQEVRAKDGYRTWFGGVEIKKTYVSAHLFPVYMHPEMLEGVDPALLKRMQGKSCFNFRRADDPALDAFAALVEAGAARFVKDGRL
jgi:hypothetical protein